MEEEQFVCPQLLRNTPRSVVQRIRVGLRDARIVITGSRFWPPVHANVVVKPEPAELHCHSMTPAPVSSDNEDLTMLQCVH